MAIRYVITPYDPIYWEEEHLDQFGEPVSDLEINPVEFVVETGKKFNIQKAGTGGTLMVDGLPSLYFGFIQNQIMDIEIDEAKQFSNFVVWYRSFVPSEQDLYLFREGSSQSLILTKDTTAEEVSEWTGLP